MLSDKAWRDGMARLNACFPAANKNLSPEDMAVRDLAYHDAIAPKLPDEAWLRAVVEVTRIWEYPFALPPPQMLLEAGENAVRSLERNPGRRSLEEIEEGKRAAAKGLAMIQAELEKRGMPPLRIRTMRELPPASGEPYLVEVTPEKKQELISMLETLK